MSIQQFWASFFVIQCFQWTSFREQRTPNGVGMTTRQLEIQASARSPFALSPRCEKKKLPQQFFTFFSKVTRAYPIHAGTEECAVTWRIRMDGASIVCADRQPEGDFVSTVWHCCFASCPTVAQNFSQQVIPGTCVLLVNLATIFWVKLALTRFRNDA